MKLMNGQQKVDDAEVIIIQRCLLLKYFILLVSIVLYVFTFLLSLCYLFGFKPTNQGFSFRISADQALQMFLVWLSTLAFGFLIYNELRVLIMAMAGVKESAEKMSEKPKEPQTVYIEYFWTVFYFMVPYECVELCLDARWTIKIVKEDLHSTSKVGAGNVTVDNLFTNTVIELNKHGKGGQQPEID